MHHNDQDAWWNNTPYEIECKGEINEIHPKYPIIIYNYALKYKQKVKEYFDSGIKNIGLQI